MVYLVKVSDILKYLVVNEVYTCIFVNQKVSILLLGIC